MPPRNTKKRKKKKKAQQQRRKDKNRQKQQKKNNNAQKKANKEILQLLKKGYNEVNISYISQLKKRKKNFSFKQETLAKCFDIIWRKCGNKMQCTEVILSKKLNLLEILIKDFKLDLSTSLSSNLFSRKDSDTLYDRIGLLCNKCLLPMLQFNIEFIAYNSYHSSLKLLILQQIHHSLLQYIDDLGVKFETNSFGITDMSWNNIIEPTLNKWWISANNLQCKSVIPWSISQGVYLNVVFPYFNVFKQYVLNNNHTLILDMESAIPLNASLINHTLNEELAIPDVVCKQLLISIGKSLLRRSRSCEDKIYDCDLEYLYMHIADLFDEGRLRWLRTDKGVKVYQSYVNSINQCIDERYPLIGKIVTYFLIGNAGMIIV